MAASDKDKKNTFSSKKSVLYHKLLYVTSSLIKLVFFCSLRSGFHWQEYDAS